MDITYFTTPYFKLAVGFVLLTMVAHVWLVVTVVRGGEQSTRRYLNAAGFKEGGVVATLMLHFARYGLKA